MEVRQTQRHSHWLDSHHMRQESREGEDFQSDACKVSQNVNNFDSTNTNLYLVAGESFAIRGYSGA